MVSKDSVMSWWDQRSKKEKGLIVLAAFLFLFMIIVMSSGSHNNKEYKVTNAAIREMDETPRVVTIAQLYARSVAEGAFVKVTGTVLQSDGSILRIENSDGKDILIEGWNLDAYEDQKVTVIGTYKGSGSYETVRGATRTVPKIEGAKLV